MKNQHLIDNLSTSEKADLFQHLYAELAGQGTDGDTELAHVNRFEAQVLRNIGGSGTVNKVTGLRQYGKGGSAPPPPPSSTTTRQVPEYAPEQREYIEDIFGKSQELYEQRSEEGFTPFPGQQLAPFAAQEQEAFGGIEALARGPGAAPAFDIARTASLGAAAPITAGEVQQGMNPYQQAVTDIGKREAVRQYQRGPQAQLRSGAVESGGLRGARRFIEEGEGQRNLNQQLADLQTMGSQQAFQQSMAEAAAARGRLANLATQMPSIGMGAYNQQMQQLGQLGGVGEAYRSRDQASIGLAQDQFQQEQMFPEETLATYLRFITNAPSPSGFQRTTQAPGVRGPSSLTQTAGLLGGLGTLAGGLGGRNGLFNQGGRVDARIGGGPTGRRAGLSGVVRRAQGGQIVRMQPGGQVRDYAGTPGLVLPIENVPVTPLQEDAQRVADAVAKFMPDISSNIAKGLNRAQDTSDRRSAYLGGSREELEDARARAAETERMIEAARAAGMGFDEYIQDYENSGFAPSAPTEETTPTSKKLEAALAAEQETVVTEQPTPERSQETLVDQFKKLMEVPEAEMSWAERLQLASTLMNAGNKGSTGSFLGDLSQFGADTAGGVGKALSSRDARALAAQKRKIKTLKDFNQFAKDAQLTPIEIEQAKIDLGLGRARTRKLDAEADDLKSKKYEYDVPETGLIREAETALKNVGTFNYDKTSFDKNTVKTPGTLDYDIAALAKMTNKSPRDLVAILNAKGLIITNNKGKHVLNREVFSDAKSRVVQSRAEGGLVGDDRPILRYPEDF